MKSAMWAVLAGMALMGAPQGAEAAYYFTSASAASGTTQVPGVTDDGYTQGAAPNSWSAESKTVTPSDFGLGWTRTAATADTGMLKASAWAQASSMAPACCSGGGGTGSATARYQDSFVVHSGQYADGTVATLTARILIDGAMPVTTDGGFWSSTQTWSWNFGMAGLAWSEGTSIFGDAINGFSRSATASAIAPTPPISCWGRTSPP